jgi:hypothetical protein
MAVRVIVAVVELVGSGCCIKYKQRWLILQYRTSTGTASLGVMKRDPIGDPSLTTGEYGRRQ